ncbi:MAG: phenylacetate-CoA oxygenase subunit PaaC [Sphingomonadales bacterium]|nr:phenylacetate-CoA oxygenase subunit PaaC [Sphingomonadales bacterium]
MNLPLNSVPIEETHLEPLRHLLTALADDHLILGHRHSEWTGLGPILEEDIAFSSIAQDQMGHALGFYTLLHEYFGTPDPDIHAFTRNEAAFSCCQLVEWPIGEYDFSLVRHLFFDLAAGLRMETLSHSSFKPLAQLATKIRGEVKYHMFHAKTMVGQLGNSSETVRSRLQTTINRQFGLALGMFESRPDEQILDDANIAPIEAKWRERWLEALHTILESAGLHLPDPDRTEPVYGGRKGYHTEFLQPLLTEMTEVFRLDPQAEW